VKYDMLQDIRKRNYNNFLFLRYNLYVYKKL
jgi:hypothetical protein